MAETLPFQDLEKKWQARWEAAGLFKAPRRPGARKFYCLEMFPYPSGRLHMGHVRNYTIGDVIARHRFMLGDEVLHPIGWDAFGLPAENAAIKHKVDPAKWTRDNIAQMRVQLKNLGLSYDWSRELATCESRYYRWNQWIFLKLLEKGLAYRRKSPVNWCPGCDTVLANEQVSAEGLCWRCDSKVEQRDLEQWCIRTTAYAQRLLDGHALLEDGWPSQVLAMQKNWIGRSEGAEVSFGLDGGRSLTVFTTRPDTLFGATFMVLSPEHPLLPSLTAPERRAAVEAYVEAARRKTKLQRQDPARAKEGVDTGARALNPANGERIPVFVAEYVLAEYGTGAIMAVPAHDQRDWDFAMAHGLPIRPVIVPDAGEAPAGRAFDLPGRMTGSGRFDGLPSEEAKKAIVESLGNKAKAVVSYRLKDWGVSRQRAWGTPIPVVHCAKCGPVPVPEAELPVELPASVPFTGKGQNPLASVKDWVERACPRCGGPGRRETDTMDTFVDSSWYFARYLDPDGTRSPFDPETAGWLPVDQYIGGIEHACMHLIYARFVHMFLADLGLTKEPEPFKRLLTQGMVTLGGSAMSKSKGNIVEPEAIQGRFGADTARLFILFAAPPEAQLDWSDEGVEGCHRFLNRVWRLADKVLAEPPAARDGDGAKLTAKAHRTAAKAAADMARHGFNTTIAALMELVNELYAYPALGDAASREAYRTLVRLLAPFAPHAAEELWERLGGTESVFRAGWPEADPRLLAEDEVEIVVQVNGKVRSRLRVPSELGEEETRRRALELPKVKELLEGASVKKVVVVPRKLVNVVVGAP